MYHNVVYIQVLDETQWSLLATNLLKLAICFFSTHCPFHFSVILTVLSCWFFTAVDNFVQQSVICDDWQKLLMILMSSYFFNPQLHKMKCLPFPLSTMSIMDGEVCKGAAASIIICNKRKKKEKEKETIKKRKKIEKKKLEGKK